ncbi:hypothetical protein [Sphingomonas sp. GC_Shp_3]|uniref:hypothetical protein n=1 Tax=Sphingomonas sp. GC_Shp_3 TaxID=2937383 RepID=UPI00226AC7E1|nr:hypothetical protein [Sphingomonas sp. GC_Shp_3]
MMILIAAALAAAAETRRLPPPPPADPLTVKIETEDADRFSVLFGRTKGRPTAEQLQEDYLAFGTYGLQVFTPHRIENAAHLAAIIAAHTEAYSKAIRVCLPIAKETTAELRATYLAFHGLFPDRALPHLYLVVGAGNSGGTAGPGAQVIGLEVLCRLADTPDKLRELLRGFYAHETVHTLQTDPDRERQGGALLSSILVEGAADFIAQLVTGRQMDPGRAAWAEPREAELWQRLEADLAVTHAFGESVIKEGTPAARSLRRWVENAEDAPDGWPGELGYWMGQRIWERWYARQSDKRNALRAMLELKDPEAVLREGRYITTPPKL